VDQINIKEEDLDSLYSFLSLEAENLDLSSLLEWVDLLDNLEK
jgi:hypothetical protein